jgi:signal transduction histidine kinase
MAAYFFGGCLDFTGFLIFYMLKTLGKALEYIIETYQVDPQVVDYVRGTLNSSLWFLSSVMLIVAICVVIVWIQYSHRIFGPLVPISRHIAELRKGNYSSRVMLRKKDEMLDLKDILNQLAADLQARHPDTRPQAESEKNV